MIPVLKSVLDGGLAVLLHLILAQFGACVWLTVAAVVGDADQMFGNRCNGFNTYSVSFDGL